MSPTRVILDVDTGVDDALAILFALAHPEIEVLGISCVAGNASLERVVENTLRILDVAGAPDIPVAAGARRPLLGRAHPDLAEHIERIVFMGGSATVGNATAVAEFNVWHDPEAAAIVLDSGVPAFMYGLDVFNRVGIDEDVASALLHGDSPLGRVVGSLLGSRVALGAGRDAVYTGLIGDAGALCALVDPGALRTELRPVRIGLAGYGRGQTLVDLRRSPGEDIVHGLAEEWETVEVALDVDAPRYAALFLETLGLA